MDITRKIIEQGGNAKTVYNINYTTADGQQKEILREYEGRVE